MRSDTFLGERKVGVSLTRKLGESAVFISGVTLNCARSKIVVTH